MKACCLLLCTGGAVAGQVSTEALGTELAVQFLSYPYTSLAWTEGQAPKWCSGAHWNASGSSLEKQLCCYALWHKARLAEPDEVLRELPVLLYHPPDSGLADSLMLLAVALHRALQRGELLLWNDRLGWLQALRPMIVSINARDHAERFGISSSLLDAPWSRSANATGCMQGIEGACPYKLHVCIRGNCSLASTQGLSLPQAAPSKLPPHHAKLLRTYFQALYRPSDEIVHMILAVLSPHGHTPVAEYVVIGAHVRKGDKELGLPLPANDWNPVEEFTSCYFRLRNRTSRPTRLLLATDSRFVREQIRDLVGVAELLPEIPGPLEHVGRLWNAQDQLVTPSRLGVLKAFAEFFAFATAEYMLETKFSQWARARVYGAVPSDHVIEIGKDGVHDCAGGGIVDQTSSLSTFRSASKQEI